MKKLRSIILGLSILFPLISYAQLIEQYELENGVISGQYASVVSTPFEGVAMYTNGNRVENTTAITGIPGIFQIDVRGFSENNQDGSINIFLGDRRAGSVNFETTPTVQTITFKVEEQPSSYQLGFVLQGENNSTLDWYELSRVGDIPPPPPPPVLPNQGAYETGLYRNMFAEFGISEVEVQARVEAVYEQLFHSDDRESEAMFIPVGDDMAYIWDTGNDDVRSEGMSYGMMMAVQMDRKEDFDRLWKWAHTYSLNKEGEMKGFFAWKVSTSGSVQDRNPAPDGEVYFATALFFASHRWGDGDGIFNYNAQANQILRDVYGNGEFRYKNSGGGQEELGLFHREEKKILYTPAGPSENYFTDPSYHLPAFFDLWALWADDNNAFWADVAETSRAFLKTTVNPENGLSPDYAYFDGRPHGDQNHEKVNFMYDAWRTVGNAAMDFYWWQKDPWQTDYANTLQAFFKSEGVETYGGLWELDGNAYNNNTDHSPGLVAMNAVASLAADRSAAFEFIENFWNTPTPTGRYRYYDGCLYMFGMLALSGNYRIYCPEGECDFQGIRPPANKGSSSSSSANSSSANSSSSSSSSSSNSSSADSGETAGGSLGLLSLLALIMLLAKAQHRRIYFVQRR